ncbi:acyltransferase [Corallococcus sp. H22C18031201]|nr:acyltransferase [Corallococcus sp. H22C18031201]
MNAPARPASEHRPDLDWLRVIAIALLHFFHTGMMFNRWDWHVKSPVPLPALEPLMELLHLVRMPLLMVISGVGTALALRHRSLGSFAKDRAKRLLWPLVLGMFVIVPPQIYAERLQRGQFAGSYLDFYPSVFEFVTYPRGSLSWHHLWFVAYLFVYCVLALPLFAWMETRGGQAFLARANAWLSRGFNVALLCLPLVLNQIALNGSPETHALVDDPRTLLHYAMLFLFGHLFGRCPGVWERLVALRHVLLGIGVAVLVPMLPDGAFPLVAERLGQGIILWTLLLSALGYARARLLTRPAWLARAQELSYPFYILHQTVIVVLGLAMLRLPLGPWALFASVLAASLLVTWALCEGAARVDWLRPCFGMKPRAPRRQASPISSTPASGHTA